MQKTISIPVGDCDKEITHKLFEAYTNLHKEFARYPSEDIKREAFMVPKMIPMLMSLNIGGQPLMTPDNKYLLSHTVTVLEEMEDESAFLIQWTACR